MSQDNAPESAAALGSGAGRVVVALGAVAAAAFVWWSSSGEADPVVAGARAPAFTLPKVGAPGDVSMADLKGKVVLINFWATWCKPCEDEMPAMERLYRAVGQQGFELVAVSVDESGEPVEAFRKRLGLSFPIVLDSTQEVAGRYQAFRFPETLLVGRDGVVVEKYIGPREWDAEVYVDRIRSLVGGAGA